MQCSSPLSEVRHLDFMTIFKLLQNKDVASLP